MHDISVSKTPSPDTVRISCKEGNGTVFVEGQFAESIKYCPLCGERLPALVSPPDLLVEDRYDTQ